MAERIGVAGTSTFFSWPPPLTALPGPVERQRPVVGRPAVLLAQAAQWLRQGRQPQQRQGVVCAAGAPAPGSLPTPARSPPDCAPLFHPDHSAPRSAFAAASAGIPTLPGATVALAAPARRLRHVRQVKPSSTSTYSRIAPHRPGSATPDGEWLARHNSQRGCLVQGQSAGWIATKRSALPGPDPGTLPTDPLPLNYVVDQSFVGLQQGLLAFLAARLGARKTGHPTRVANRYN